MKSEIIGCLLTHWLSITSILFQIVIICVSLFQCHYLKNTNLFPIFLFHLWNLHLIFNIFLKKKIVIANLFSKLKIVKNLVRPLSKKRRFRTSFDSQHVKVSETLVKSAWEHFYQILPSLSREMVQKIPPWLKFEIIGLFVTTLTADDKYAVPECESLQFPIQMILP